MNEARFYRVVCRGVRLFFRPAATEYEVEPDGPAVYVCNHSSIRGPVIMTLYFPRPHKTWAISHAVAGGRQTAVYAYHDILFGRSKRWKLPSRLAAKFISYTLPPLLREAGTIPVHRDLKIKETLRASVDALERGEDVVIFAESPKRYSEYVNELQEGFVRLGMLYFQRTGKKLKFYPAYVEKKNRKISVAAPVKYDPDRSVKDQRSEICSALRDSIERKAREMKKHKPVPFLPPRWYGAYGEFEDDFAGYWQMIDEEIKEENKD